MQLTGPHHDPGKVLVNIKPPRGVRAGIDTRYDRIPEIRGQRGIQGVQQAVHARLRHGFFLGCFLHDGIRRAHRLAGVAHCLGGLRIPCLTGTADQYEKNPQVTDHTHQPKSS